MVFWYHPLVAIITIVVSLILLYIVYRILRAIILGIIGGLGSLWGSIVPGDASSSDRSKPTTSSPLSKTDREEPKYPDDPDAQQAHEEAQDRSLADTLPKGREYDTVVLENTGNSQRNEFRVNLYGVNVFVDENVPDSVTEGDTIRIQITHYSGKMNAAHARFVSF